MLLLWAVPDAGPAAEHHPRAPSRSCARIVPAARCSCLLLFLPLPQEDDAGAGVRLLLRGAGVPAGAWCSCSARIALDALHRGRLLRVGAAHGAAASASRSSCSPCCGTRCAASAGLRTYFSRYLLSVGMPFELWMRRVAELAETEPDAAPLPRAGAARDRRVPVDARRAAGNRPTATAASATRTSTPRAFLTTSSSSTFYTDVRLSPALFLHVRLLAQVVAEFYEGKRRESALRRNAYLQAVHETGARLTHDVKNLLQSLYALTSMAPKERRGGLRRPAAAPAAAAHAAPAGHARQAALAGDPHERARRCAPARWWTEVERRMAGADVTLEAALERRRQHPRRALRQLRRERIDNARAKAPARTGHRRSDALRVRRATTWSSRCATTAAPIPEAAAAAPLPRAHRARARAWASAFTRPRGRRPRRAGASKSPPTATATCASGWRSRPSASQLSARRSAVTHSPSPRRQSAMATPKSAASFAFDEHRVRRAPRRRRVLARGDGDHARDLVAGTRPRLRSKIAARTRTTWSRPPRVAVVERRSPATHAGRGSRAVLDGAQAQRSRWARRAGRRPRAAPSRVCARRSIVSRKFLPRGP